MNDLVRCWILGTLLDLVSHVTTKTVASQLFRDVTRQWELCIAVAPPSRVVRPKCVFNTLTSSHPLYIQKDLEERLCFMVTVASTAKMLLTNMTAKSSCISPHALLFWFCRFSCLPLSSDQYRDPNMWKSKTTGDSNFI